MTDTKSPIGDLDLKKAQELEESLDHEIRFRPLLPRTAWLVAGLLLALSLFHYYTAGFGLLPEVTHRGIHLAFVIGLIFLVFPAFKSKTHRAPQASLLRPMGIHVLDWALFLAAVASSLYVPWIFHDLVFRVGNPGTVDVIMGSLAILVLIEATRTMCCSACWQRAWASASCSSTSRWRWQAAFPAGRRRSRSSRRACSG